MDWKINKRGIYEDGIVALIDGKWVILNFVMMNL